MTDNIRAELKSRGSEPDGAFRIIGNKACITKHLEKVQNVVFEGSLSSAYCCFVNYHIDNFKIKRN